MLPVMGCTPRPTDDRSTVIVMPHEAGFEPGWTCTLNVTGFVSLVHTAERVAPACSTGGIGPPAVPANVTSPKRQLPDELLYGVVLGFGGGAPAAAAYVGAAGLLPLC